MFTSRSRQALVAKTCAIVVRARLLGWQASNALRSLYPYTNDPIELLFAATAAGLIGLGERVCKLASTYHSSRVENATCTHRGGACHVAPTTRAPGAL